ncbi:4035_t:CDS:1, partial [Racocetra fulgida]
ILKDQKYLYDKKSDVYSTGVVLWEISSDGRAPFNQVDSLNQVLRIIQGSREEPVTGTPTQYINLYSKCWDDEPNNRPLMMQIVQQLNSLELDPKYNSIN